MEKPTMKQRLNDLSKFIWNSEKNQVLGRGGRSWAEIGVFYLIYYVCLASFFAATLAVFYETVDERKPKLQSDSSLLNGNPGMGFRPRLDVDESMPKISVKPATEKNKDFKEALDSFLSDYTGNLDTAECVSYDKTRPGAKEACRVKTDFVDTHCNPKDEYGASVGEPCVLVKLNKVFGWEPKLWDTKEDSPLKSYNLTYSKSVIPIRCYPKDSDDINDLGTLKYYPEQGFPIKYFPYENQKDYRSPFVMVKFDDAKRGKNFEIECRAYAKNIEYDRTDIQGSVQFKLYISKK